MGLFDFFRSMFGNQPPARDVSRLTDVDPSITSEIVNNDGEPLKPMHRRRALRDKRLLPKPKPKRDPYVWNRPKKPKVMSRDEADRLFADTMRTKNRAIRDLATDEAQLRHYDLPIWSSEADVAAALGLSESQLQHYSIHRQRETTPHYVTFAIRKRSGGVRLIHAPKLRLKALQRRLNQLLINKLPVSNDAHGFRVGRSVATNAKPHVGKGVVIKLDLVDCFPTIHYGRVRGLLISLGYSYPVATSLAVLMTEAPRQPVAAEGKLYHVPVGPRVCVQGAPTSPGLCNAILLRMDRRLAGLARKYGFAYSRYADDLTLSGDDTSRIKVLLTIAKLIVKEEGFRLHQKKTRVLRRRQRQQVAGVVVNDQLGLSRTDRRRLRAAIHQLDPSDTTTRRHIQGRLAYLHMLNPQQAEPLRRAFLASCGLDSH